MAPRLRFALLLGMALAPLHAAAEPSLASAPIDATMFRNGEVQRSARPFDRWTLVCDAIPRLGHRFCSLQAASTTVGSATLSLTVSTGDDGRPAAMLRVPFGLSLPFGIRVKALGAGTNEAEHRVAVALCSTRDCEAVWTLTAGDMAALRGGAGLRITLQGWRFAVGRTAPLKPVAAVIGGHGFAEAVAASLQ